MPDYSREWKLIPLAMALATACWANAAAGKDLPGLGSATVLAESDKFVIVCGLGTGDACDGADPVGLRKELASAARQLDLVREWFDELDFPRTALRTRDNRYGVYFGGSAQCGGNFACSRNSVETGFERALILTDALLALDAATRTRTLAHELAHVGNLGGERNLVKWQDEAVAEATGTEWGRLNGQPTRLFPPLFELDLDLPFHQGTQGGYEKADYFHELARRVGADQASHGHRANASRERLFLLLPLFDYRRPAAQPMVGLYGRNGAEKAFILADELLRFDKAFPSWVAKFNHESGVFPAGSGGGQAGYYYRRINRITDAPPATIGQAYVHEHSVAVDEFAASAFLIDKLPVEGASTVPDEQRLVVVEHNVIHADRLADINLVFEHKVADRRRHRFLVKAADAVDTGFVRLTNAGTTPDATKAQTARLMLSLSPVRIELPRCVASGSSVPLRVTTGSLEGVGNYRIEASAGRMDGLVFHAPAGSRTVRFHLVIDSAITRSRHQLAPARRPAVRVALGEVDVGGDCMIRVLHNKGLVITYNPDGDYSQYQAKRNFIFYRPGGDMDVWTPGGGWADPLISQFMQPILGGASAGQILGHFGSPIPPGLGNIDRPGGDVGATLAHLPVLLTDTFSFSAMSAMPSDDGKVARPESTPCPARGTEGCVRLVQKLQGEQVVTAFDSRRRLVGLLFGGHMFVFEYGVFEIRRPPDW